MSGDDRPLVSVLIPVRNGDAGIVEAVTSALHQSTATLDVEVIIVDDGSTDATVSRVGSINDDRITLVSQDPQGCASARNHAATLARGDWLAPLDSDDTFLPRALQRLVSGAGDDVDVVCGAAVRVSSDGTTELQHPTRLGREYHSVRALFLAGAMLIRAQAWTEVGGQLPGLAFGENGELGMRLAANAHRLGRRVVSIDTPTFTYNERGVVRHDDVARAEAARLIAETDHDLLARSRRARASYWSISAVHCARAGQTGAALSAQLVACRTDPLDPRQLARLVMMAVPPLRRRRYPRRVLGQPGS